MSVIFWFLLHLSILDIKKYGNTAATTTKTPEAALMQDPCMALKTPYLKSDLPSREPFGVFKDWTDLAKQCGFKDNQMALATASKNGVPSVRNVIMTEQVDDGFVFYSNYDSLKGRQLEENPVASGMLYFEHNRPTDRQVIFTGNVTKLSSKMSDAYWNSVSDNYQLLNYLKQGQIIRSYVIMDVMRNETIRKIPAGTMQRPPAWGGYLIRPYVIEFSQGSGSFLRDRIVFLKLRPDELFDPVTMEMGEDGWVIYRILP